MREAGKQPFHIKKSTGPHDHAKAILHDPKKQLKVPPDVIICWPRLLGGSPTIWVRIFPQPGLARFYKHV